VFGHLRGLCALHTDRMVVARQAKLSIAAQEAILTECVDGFLRNPYDSRMLSRIGGPSIIARWRP
jgi:hypothetical protein